MALHHYAGAVDVHIGTAQRGNHAIATAFSGSKIDENHLILPVVDDGAQFRTATHEVFRCELAFKNGELQMVAIAAHLLVDAAQPLFVRYVVADKVARAHEIHIGSGNRMLINEKIQILWGGVVLASAKAP